VVEIIIIIIIIIRATLFRDVITVVKHDGREGEINKNKTKVKERKRKSKDKRYCRTAGVQVPGLRTGTVAYTVHSTT
jgi:hypothetical protein